MNRVQTIKDYARTARAADVAWSRVEAAQRALKTAFRRGMPGAVEQAQTALESARGRYTDARSTFDAVARDFEAMARADRASLETDWSNR